MNSAANSSHYLTCERKRNYFLLMFAAGMMGAYTYNLRGGIFCNAQTGNFVLMAIAFGKGNIWGGFYYFIPITAYFLGAVLSESLPNPVKRLHIFRWDTYLVAFEMIVLFLMGCIPLSAPDQIVQVTINFIASMQYNTFRQAEGIPMSTTFCTNHLRQTGIAFTKFVKKKDSNALRRGLTHLSMLFYFFLGGVILTFACKYMAEKAIWLVLIPMSISLVNMAYADIFKEHNLLGQKPAGH